MHSLKQKPFYSLLILFSQLYFLFFAIFSLNTRCYLFSHLCYFMLDLDENINGWHCGF